MHWAHWLADYCLLAKRQGSPEETLVTTVLSIVAVIIYLIYAMGSTIDVNVKNGRPHCPQCGRQVSFRREHCRACGYRFRQFLGGTGPSRPSYSPPSPPALATQPAARPVSSWDPLHGNPGSEQAKMVLRMEIEKKIKLLLIGPKKIYQGTNDQGVMVFRSRVHYYSVVKEYISPQQDRQGFVVAVPIHGFEIRVTCPRIVPAGVPVAPWEDLMANLCKIDRSIIRSGNFKSQPLDYVSTTGSHPYLRVEVLKRPSQRMNALPTPEDPGA